MAHTFKISAQEADTGVYVSSIATRFYIPCFRPAKAMQ